MYLLEVLTLMQFDEAQLQYCIMRLSHSYADPPFAVLVWSFHPSSLSTRWHGQLREVQIGDRVVLK
jgi:hypothetical protein